MMDLEHFHLITQLAEAMEQAAAAGDVERARLLHSTLDVELHNAWPDHNRDTLPAAVYYNGRPDPEALAQLGVRPD